MTLDETYEQILLAIDSKERKHVIRLLQCLVVSCRPLRTNELAEVLATQFDTGQIPRLNMDWRPENLDETVLLACSNIITTIDLGDHHDDNDHGDTRFIHFSHHSVKEFLTSERLADSKDKSLSQYCISPKSAHTTLAQSCIGTLLQLDNHTKDIVRGFPLAKYAARYWLHHVQCGDVEPRIENGMEYLFDPYKTHFAVWVSIHDIDHVSSDAPPSEPIIPSTPSPLYYATLFGFLRLVEYLVIIRRQNPNNSHGGLCSPLHAAALLGHTAIAQCLLEHAASVNAQDTYHPTPLHRAVERGNLDVTQLLLGYGADVNVLDHYGVSPLHKACRYQNLDLAELLVKGGASVNVRDNSKSTPLHEASRNGNLNVMQFLLSHCADINVLNLQGVAPLHEASRSQKFNAMELLVKSGANVNVRGKSMSTPLHKASGRGDLDVVRVLLGLGADVNVRHRGVTPLHEAIRYQKFDVVKLLLKGGADVNTRDKFKSTALHEAAGIGNLDIARLLFNNGADINALDHWGNSPLHTALRSRKFNVVELLVKGGAVVNVRDKSKSTPFQAGSASGLDNEGIPPLHKAIRSRKLDAVQLLVNGGANVNIRDKSNSTPLHEASAVGNLDIVQLLLSHGANINAFDHRGDYPLHTALRFQNFDVVELLVKNGADVKVRESSARSGEILTGTSCVKLSALPICVTLILLCVGGYRYAWMVGAVATVAVAVTAVVSRYR
jgi:ankyrin repeat protein